MVECTASGGLAQACRDVLPKLRSQVGLRTWLVTVRDGPDEILLHHYGADELAVDGLRWSWADSPVASILAGAAPAVAPRVTSIPALRRSPIVAALRPRSLIAAGLEAGDEVLGGLYGLDSEVAPRGLAAARPLIQSYGILLAAVYAADAARRRPRAGALTDPLTGALNDAGWQQLLTAEEERCRRYAGSSGVIVVDIDDLRRVNAGLGQSAGEDMICRTARVLSQGSRASDTVARCGRDEFAILAVEADREALAAHVRRLRVLLHGARVRASVGWGVRPAAGGLPAAWLAAREQMYRAKQARRASLLQSRGVRPLVGVPRDPAAAPAPVSRQRQAPA
ncbi:MAG: GGDEF domain-containing protein [Actinomycetota bacterium]|nr:GGDEF domain-containing protein [Actinomycetota bacterium]